MSAKEQELDVVGTYARFGVDLLRGYWSVARSELPGLVLWLEELHSRARKALIGELVELAGMEGSRGEKYRVAAWLLEVVDGLSGPCAAILAKIIQDPEISGSWTEIDPVAAARIISLLEQGLAKPELRAYAEEFSLLVRLVRAKAQGEFEEIAVEMARLAYEKYEEGLPIIMGVVQSAFRDGALGEDDGGRKLAEPDIRLYLPGDDMAGQKTGEILAAVAGLHPGRQRQVRPMWVDLVAQAGWLISMTQGEAFDEGVCVLVANAQKDLGRARDLANRLGLQADGETIDKLMMQLMLAHEVAHQYFYDGQEGYEEMFLEELFADVAAIVAFCGCNQDVAPGVLAVVIMASYVGGCREGDRLGLGEEEYRYAVSANWVVDQMRNAGLMGVDESGRLWVDEGRWGEFAASCKQAHQRLWERDGEFKAELQDYRLESVKLARVLG